jgi:mono/diheme cytochrome c family protein
MQTVMKRSFVTVGLMALCATWLQAEEVKPPTRSLPTRLNPVAQPPPPTVAVTAPPVDPHAGHNHGPTTTAQTAAPVSPTPPVTTDLPANILVWDAETKAYKTKPGETKAGFTFYFTNVSSGVVTINSAAGSCGCTVPKLPTLPWRVEAGATGEIPVEMNVPGKTGTIMKTVTVNTDKGFKRLTVSTEITPEDPKAMGPGDRGQNVELAKADRQAIFKGDCASCHVQQGRGKLGKELYDASCGICHDAEHRAEMVPNLRALKHDTNADYWRTWISLGKEKSLMAAFSQAHGGPLTDAEIESIVQYLTTAIPSKAASGGGSE